jgi:hypothetical protein
MCSILEPVIGFSTRKVAPEVFRNKTLADSEAPRTQRTPTLHVYLKRNPARFFNLSLTEQEKADLIEYLLSI